MTSRKQRLRHQTDQPDLARVIRMNGRLYQRIRRNCCEFSGLTPTELDRHAAAITVTVGKARAAARRKRQLVRERAAQDWKAAG